MKDKLYIECKHCGHTEEVNKELFAKILGGAVIAFGFKAWVGFLFAGTGFALPLCIAIITGGAALIAFSDTVVKWLNGRYKCPVCKNKEWDTLTGRELKLKAMLDEYPQKLQKEIDLQTAARIAQLKSKMETGISAEEMDKAISEVKIQLEQQSRLELATQKGYYQSELERLKKEKQFSESRVRQYEQKINDMTLEAEKIIFDKKEEIDKLKKQNKKQAATIEELRKKNQELLKKQDDFVRQRENASENNNNIIISNEQIHSYLLEALDKAKYEVCIMSPWANGYVVSQILNLIKRAAKRKVTVKIVYGIENSNYKGDKSNDEESLRKTERELKKLANIYAKENKNNYFKTKYFSSHSKLIICDDSFYVITSCNPLSHDGSLWGEIGEVSKNKKNIKDYKEEYFNF